MDRATLSVEAAPWNDAAAQLLAAAVDYKREQLDNIRASVEHAGATLLHVAAAGRLVAAVVMRVDPLPSGPEGVIVAAAGRLPGVRLFDLLPHFEARFAGVKAFRVHTSRPGMVRRLLRAGYAIRETVLEKPCSA